MTVRTENFPIYNELRVQNRVLNPEKLEQRQAYHLARISKQVEMNEKKRQEKKLSLMDRVSRYFGI